MNSVIELLRNRRSIRKFEDKPVEQEKIDAMLQAALMAPSSKRCTPWHFIVVSDKEKLAKIAASRTMGSAFVENAPLAILVLADESKSDVWVEDASIAATLIMIEANDLGLGCCWVQARNRQKDETTSTEDYLRSFINFPENLKAECVIAVGYKGEEKKPFDDAHILKDRVHYNAF